jgi:hypothetical protein
MATATDGQVDVKGQIDENVDENLEVNEDGTEVEVERLEMSREEYDAALQKEADRRVAQAIKKREAEHKKELEKKVVEARKEAEELAKLSESERMKVEKEREEMTLAKQREELTKERNEFEMERLKLQAEKELAIRKLPIEFSAYVLGGDADDTFERITVLEEQWQKALETEINERLKSKTPKLGTSNKKAYYTRQQVEAMSQAEVAANLPEIEESMKQWA